MVMRVGGVGGGGVVFFFNDTATTEIYTLSLHDALPIYLDLHDNYLESVDNIQALSYLSHLDVSLNRIKHLTDLHSRLGK